MHLSTFLLFAVAGAVPVEATTLDGEAISGRLQSLSATAAQIETAGQSRQIPVPNLHELRFSAEPLREAPDIVLRLTDGSQMAAAEVVVSPRSAQVTSDVLGKLELPKSSVHSLQLARADSKVRAAWDELTQRDARDDLVVVRKGDSLDHIGGVVSGIDAKAVTLLLDGSAVSIPRSRVFGVVFAAARPSPRAAVGRVELTNGDRLSATAISSAGEAANLELTAGPSLTLPVSVLQRIDFSLGKILYLSDEQPSQIDYPTDHKFFLIDVWKFRQGENSMGDALQIGGRIYDRGLWIHSGTTLTYRLNRQFRRLRGVAGIDEGIGESCLPTIGMVLRGDGRELLRTDLSRGDEPRNLDVDVSGVRELQIEVVSTDPDGVCEHLGLGDVRVIK